MQIKEKLNKTKEFIKKHKWIIVIDSGILCISFITGRVIQKTLTEYYVAGHNIAVISGTAGAIKVVGEEKAAEIAVEADKIMKELTELSLTPIQVNRTIDSTMKQYLKNK